MRGLHDIWRYGIGMVIPEQPKRAILKGQYRHDQQGMESEC